MMIRTKLWECTQAALEHTNKGKHGPLFGEVRMSQAAPLVEQFFIELAERVKKGERITINGFGIFSLRMRMSRKIRPFRSGGVQSAELVELPATWAAHFTPAKSLRKVKR